MASPESALSELLDAFRAGDGVDLIRDAVRVALQEPGTDRGTQIRSPRQRGTVPPPAGRSAAGRRSGRQMICKRCVLVVASAIAGESVVAKQGLPPRRQAVLSLMVEVKGCLGIMMRSSRGQSASSYSTPTIR